MTIAEFIQIHIIYQFDILDTIKVDNSWPFKSIVQIIYQVQDKRKSLFTVLRSQMGWLKCSTKPLHGLQEDGGHK